MAGQDNGYMLVPVLKLVFELKSNAFVIIEKTVDTFISVRDLDIMIWLV